MYTLYCFVSDRPILYVCVENSDESVVSKLALLEICTSKFTLHFIVWLKFRLKFSSRLLYMYFLQLCGSHVEWLLIEQIYHQFISPCIDKYLLKLFDPLLCSSLLCFHAEFIAASYRFSPHIFDDVKWFRGAAVKIKVIHYLPLNQSLLFVYAHTHTHELSRAICLLPFSAVHARDVKCCIVHIFINGRYLQIICKFWKICYF